MRDHFAVTRKPLADPLVDLRFGDGHRPQIRQGIGDRSDELNRAVSAVRVSGAQHLVPIDHICHRRGECTHIERTGEPNSCRNVVRPGLGIHLVDRPHALLRERKRHRGRALPREERHLGAPTHERLDTCCERSNRRGLEDRANRHLGVQRCPEPRHDLRGDQRVAAQSEEIVVQPDSIDTENIREGTCHHFLDWIGRGTELTDREVRGRQCPAVQLAVGVERQRIEDNECRRHHVRRQTRGQ